MTVLAMLNWILFDWVWSLRHFGSTLRMIDNHWWANLFHIKRRRLPEHWRNQIRSKRCHQPFLLPGSSTLHSRGMHHLSPWMIQTPEIFGGHNHWSMPKPFPAYHSLTQIGLTPDRMDNLERVSNSYECNGELTADFTPKKALTEYQHTDPTANEQWPSITTSQDRVTLLWVHVDYSCTVEQPVWSKSRRTGQTTENQCYNKCCVKKTTTSNAYRLPLIHTLT